MTFTQPTQTPQSPHPTPARQRRNRSESEWRKLFEAFNSSGLTQTQFCKDHHISSGSFHKWKKRLFSSNQSNKASPFIEVAPIAPNAIIPTSPHFEKPQTWDVELELAKGCILRIRLS